MVVKCPKCGSSRIDRDNGILRCKDCGYLLGEDSEKNEKFFQDSEKVKREPSPVITFSNEGVKFQDLLKAIKDLESSECTPAVDFERGVYYPEIKKAMKAADNTIESSLKALEESGILVAEIWDNLVVCPGCGSHKLFIQLRCPSCGSGKLIRRSTIQHLSCGHYDLEEAFVKEDRLICPKCGKTLKALGVDYRRPGLVYKCLNCGSYTPAPKFKYTCVNGHVFYDNEFVLKELKSYKLDPVKKTVIEKLLFEIRPMLHTLIEHGLHVEAPVTLRGASGVELNFSFAAWLSKADRENGRQPFLVGEVFLSDKPVGVMSILALKAESTDIGSKVIVILAVPGLDDKARELGRVYGMHVLEARSLNALNEKIKGFLEKVMKSVRSSSNIGSMKEELKGE